jgi:Na+/H+ antiporter NhaC
MSKLNSPNNNLIKTADRQKYIFKLEQNIGFNKGITRTPIHYKIMDKYEDITSKIPKRHIFIFISLFIISLVILYYFKPKFILKQTNLELQNKFKMNSNKNLNEKVMRDREQFVNYWKLILYSLLISVILFFVLFFTRTKVLYIRKLFENEEQ